MKIEPLKEEINSLNTLAGVYATYTHNKEEKTFNIHIKSDHKINYVSSATAFLGEFTENEEEEYNTPEGLLKILKITLGDFRNKIENKIQDY